MLLISEEFKQDVKIVTKLFLGWAASSDWHFQWTIKNNDTTDMSISNYYTFHLTLVEKLF